MLQARPLLGRLELRLARAGLSRKRLGASPRGCACWAPALGPNRRSCPAVDELAPVALGVLGLGHPLRRCAIACMQSLAFEPLMILTILANGLFMGLDASADRSNPSVRLCETLFTAIYTAELVVRLVAMGLCANRHSYMRQSAWNWLDLAVVTTGWLSFFVYTWGSDAIQVNAFCLSLPKCRTPTFAICPKFNSTLSR